MSVSSDADKPQIEADLTDEQVQQLLLEAESRIGIPESTQSKRPISQAVTNSPASQPVPWVPKSSLEVSLRPYIQQEGDVAKVDSVRVLPNYQTNSFSASNPLKARESQSDNKRIKNTAGSDWFELPRTDLTTELRRDLQLLKMRSVLDPKRHYKKENGKAEPPRFSQVGTVIQGPAEFFNSRISKRDRNRTFVEETMATERETKRLGSKYQNVQAHKSSGKKAFYKNLKAKRSQKSK